MSGWPDSEWRALSTAVLKEGNGGKLLPSPIRRYAQRLVGTALDDVRVVQSSITELLHTVAVTAGNRIVVHPSAWAGFDDQHTVHLLFHELSHVAQQRTARIETTSGLTLDAALESEAETVADTAVRLLASPRPERLLTGVFRAAMFGASRTLAWQPHPGTPIIRRAISWLASRGAKGLSKHIGKHMRRNCEKAIHGVFRSIDKIRPLVMQTLQEGVQLSEHFAKSSGLEAVERAGVKLARQTSTTPGKYRWLLQKEFKTAIGTKGERVLRVVLDMSGRLVTAFPADKLLTILGTIFAMDLISEGIAEAAEGVAREAERLDRFKEMERNKIDLWDFVPGIGEIWGGKLNEFEDLELAFDRWVDQVVNDVIVRIEDRAGCSMANREAFGEVVRIGIGLPVLLEQ